MKQGRMWTALALVATLALAAPLAQPAHAAASKTATAPAKHRAAALHQFSGVVTALDRGSLTVERTGKHAKSLVFVRHPEMKTTGELAKDARVTVWYREEDGHTVAHRVVVKSPELAAER